MSIFNKKQIEAMVSGDYVCSKCGARMEFEDEWEDTLVCPNCGHDIDLEHYGFENDEEYEALYPTKEEVLDYDEDEGENNGYEDTYDEVCGELDDYTP